MKRIFVFVAALVMGLALVSCVKEGEGMVFHVSMPETMTRTTLGEKDGNSYPVVWSEGDRICVNGLMSRPLDASAAGRTSASFFFDESVSGPYNVTYGCVAGTHDLVSVPSVQMIGKDATFNDGLMPMAASSQTTSGVKMRHLGSVLLIPVLDDGEVRSISNISVSSSDGSPISGIYRIGTSDGLLDGTLSAVNGYRTICLTSGEGVALSYDDAAFAVILAPGAYPEGFDVSLTAVDGAVMHFHVMPEEEFIAGTVYECPQAVFSEDDKADMVIRTADDLSSFRARVNAGEVTLSAVITKDIEVTDGIWDSPLNLFQGTLDGTGHTVSGLGCPMFNELRGTVKNLALDSEIEMQLPSPSDTMWTGILAQRLSAGGGTNSHIGHILNCTVSGTLKVINTSTTKANANVGGIVGYMIRGKVVGCRNMAEISVESAASTKKVNVGGIIGRAYAGGAVLRIADCVNEGKLVVSGTPTVYYVGGVIGESDSVSGTDIPNTIDGCVNLGTVIVTAAPTGDGSMSGDVAGHSTNSLVNCL